jgi:hypothetical protein
VKQNYHRSLPHLLLGGTIFYAGLLWLLPTPTLAQFSSPKEVAQFVYGRLSNLPLENQYVRLENNKQAADSTLVSRFVQYHTSIKGRSPLYRLDWKMTLADYLGVNDYLQPETYPGHAFLKGSAMEKDAAIIQKLNRNQRNALIQAIVDGFTGNATASTTTSEPETDPSPQPKAANEPYRPTLQPLASPEGSSVLKKPRQPSSPKPTGEAQFLRP